MRTSNKPANIIAFDIETVGLGGDACFWSWAGEHGSGGSPCADGSDFTAQFMDRCLTRQYAGGVVVAHNGLRFDYLRLDYPMILDAGYSIRVWQGSGDIRGMDIVKGRNVWRLRDTVTWSPSTLAAFVQLFGPPGTGKLSSPDWDKETFDIHNPDHVRYAIHDSEILYSAASGFDRFMREETGIGVRDGVTLSGMTVKALRKSIVGELPSFPLQTDPLGRESYHGAITCAFRVGTFDNLIYLDINSSYASCMLENDLPTGVPFRCGADARLPGDHLVIATVEIPVGVFPFLIARDERGQWHRMNGVIRCLCWNFELDMQEALGGRVLAIHARYAFPESFSGVRRFVDQMARIRERDYHGPVGQLAKLMQNSLYGKFSCRPIEYNTVIAMEPPCPEATPFRGSDGNLVPWHWCIPSNRKTVTRVFWGSYITAKARTKLMDYVRMIPPQDWLYSDTDSLLIPRRHLDIYRKHIGSEYGKLKVEGEIKRIDIRAKKVYAGEMSNGELRFKAKGIPKRLRQQSFQSKKGDTYNVRGEKIKSTRDNQVWYEQSIGLSVAIQGNLRLKENPKVFTKISPRTLSGPGSLTSGRYDSSGRWVPKICTSPGFDPEKLGPYSFSMGRLTIRK